MSETFPIIEELASPRDICTAEPPTLAEVSLANLPWQLREREVRGLAAESLSATEMPVAFQGVRLNLRAEKRSIITNTGAVSLEDYIFYLDDEGGKNIVDLNVSIGFVDFDIYIASTRIGKDSARRNTPVFRGIGAVLYKKIFKFLESRSRELQVPITHFVT